MDRDLEDLGLKPEVLNELRQHGYMTVGDLAAVDRVKILRLPGVTGYELLKIAKALDRPQRILSIPILKKGKVTS
jgi:hypothetical protein